MTEEWWPEAGRRYVSPLTPLAFTGGPPKGLLHTTEGTTIAGAVAAYRANRSWPHITLSFEGGRFSAEQHMPITQAARSLRNLSGGVQTNTDTVIQAEIVAYASDPRPWRGEFLAGIIRWMRWVEANAGVPRRCTVEFLPYPASYGASKVRLKSAAWDSYSGWLGHMHAPENDHGDPGAIPIAALLLSEEDIDVEEILARLDQMAAELAVAKQNAIDGKNYGVANQASIEVVRQMVEHLSPGGVDVEAVVAEVLRRLGESLRPR